MNFVTIDFETANSWRGSICSVGVVLYQNYEPFERFQSLVKPEDSYFDPFNTSIHGITEEMVKNSPEFPNVLKEISHYLESYPVIAHNASFDISCLRHSLDSYNLSYPNMTYGCTRILANRILPGLFSYSLPVVAEEIGINPNDWNHHNALSDAEICGEIFAYLAKKENAQTFEELLTKNSICAGKLFKDKTDYQACQKESADKRIINGKPNPSADKSNLLYGKSVAFTGSLTSMHREQATERVFDQGGFVKAGVTKELNYLVVGSYLDHQLKGALSSNKLKKAYELIQKGQELEIITEYDFLSMLNK